jgi:splicing factor 3B subunit 3
MPPLPPHLLLQDPTGEAASEAQKHLTMYELDLGLNHVVRKYSEPIDNGANMLIPVPGAGDGPGARRGWWLVALAAGCWLLGWRAVVVCCAVLWFVCTALKGKRIPRALLSSALLACCLPPLPAGGVLVCAENFLIYKNVDHPEVRAVIPRRTSLSGERGVLITASTAFKQKAGFYIFVQVRAACLLAG